MIPRVSGLIKLWPLAAILALATILVGCSSSTVSLPSILPTASTSPAPQVTATASSPAALTPAASVSPTASTVPTPTPTGPVPAAFIISPLYNVPVLPGDITVKVKVSNFNLVNKIGQANAAGEGHLIYYLDVTPPVTPDKPATTAAGTFAETADTSYVWPNVAAGDHFLDVQLVNNDGSPLTPPVTLNEPLPVQAPAPTATASPTASPSATPSTSPSATP